MQPVNTPWTNVLADHPDLFRQANMELARAAEARGPSRAGGKGHRLLFSGMLHCDCGEIYLAQENSKDPSDRSLRCQGHKMGTACGRKRGISLRVVERAVLTKLGEFIDGPRLEAEYAGLVMAESEAKAKKRAAERAAIDKEISQLEARLARKLEDEVPDTPIIKEARDRDLLRLSDEIETRRNRKASMTAPVPVHTLMGTKMGSLAEQIEEMVGSAPAVYLSEAMMRKRAAIRQIVKSITFDFVEERVVDLHMVFDFRGPNPGDETRGVFQETTRIEIATQRQRAETEMRELAAKDEVALTAAQLARLDRHPIAARLFSAIAEEERHKLFNLVLLVMATKCSAKAAARALGIEQQRVSYLLFELRNSSDLSEFGKVYADLRPDLELDVAGLLPQVRNYKNLRYRLELADHPLLRHPLAHPGPGRDLSDAEWVVVLDHVKSPDIWRKREDHFRRFLNAFLSTVRSGKRYIDLDPVYGDHRRMAQMAPAFIYDGDLARVTPPLLRHAGLLGPDETVVCREPPSFGRGAWVDSDIRYARTLGITIPKKASEGGR